MTRICKICSHSEKTRIEKFMLDGVPLEDIAKEAGVSKSSLSRHFRNHMNRISPLEPIEATEELTPQKILENMKSLVSGLKTRILAGADLFALGVALDSFRRSVSTLVKLTDLFAKAIPKQRRTIGDFLDRVRDYVEKEARGEITLEDLRTQEVAETQVVSEAEQLITQLESLAQTIQAKLDTQPASIKAQAKVTDALTRFYELIAKLRLSLGKLKTAQQERPQSFYELMRKTTVDAEEVQEQWRKERDLKREEFRKQLDSHRTDTEVKP